MFKKIGLIVILGIAMMTHAETTTTENLSDSQIEKIVMTIDKSEVDAAKIAKKQSKNKDVLAFAKQMLKEHGKNKNELKSLAKNVSLEPEESTMSGSLKDDAMKSNADLKAAVEFDKAYVAEQINMHQKALDTLDSTLIPNAKNADLRAFLQKTREHVSNHLDKAKALQSKIL